MVSPQIKKRLNRATGLLKAWKNKSTNPRGKATIFNQYISSSFTYHSYAEHLPEDPNIYKNLHTTTRWFFSNFKENPTNNRGLIKLERLEAPRKQGGLGVINIKTRHQAQKAWIFSKIWNSPNSTLQRVWREEITALKKILRGRNPPGTGRPP